MTDYCLTILVIGQVNDAPNQIRYQRVLALAEAYPLYVVTTGPLPEVLRGKVREVYVVGRWLSLWQISLRLARRLGAEGEVVIHTVYAPRLMIAGFLCRVMLPCRWIYDLYDHPSLTWSGSRGLKRVVKRGVWSLVLSRMLRRADVWVIGMHPGILSHLPVPRRECRIVLSGGPGIQAEPVVEAPAKPGSELSICYAGWLRMKRGADLIAAWAREYDGPPACLHLMGQEDDDAVAALEDVRAEAERRGLKIVRHGWTEHGRVLEILRSGDIGLCPIDPDVLNYRYAYPIKIIEYMSQGLIPVATDGHGVRAMIRQGENGFVARYDAASFSRAIHEAIIACQDPARKEAIGLKLRETVEGREWQYLNQRLTADIETALAMTQ